MNIFSNLIKFNFSEFIAFLLPGFFTLFSLRYVSGYFDELFKLIVSKDQTVGVPFLVILFSLIAGIIISILRGFVLDWIHHSTKVTKPTISYMNLDKDKLTVFKEMVESKYRFYQFNGNMFISFVILLISRYIIFGESIFYNAAIFFTILIISVILFINSRKLLKDIYEIIEAILNSTDK